MHNVVINSQTARKEDLREIERAIDILHEQSQVVEIRVPRKFGAISGYFDDHRKLARAVKQLSEAAEYDGVYYTLNPCHEALLARRVKNVLHYEVKETTTDAEIIRRRWLLIDFDPKRPKGISATKREKHAAGLVAIEVARALRKQGWPVPVIALSGNGYHLLYRSRLSAPSRWAPPAHESGHFYFAQTGHSHFAATGKLYGL